MSPETLKLGAIAAGLLLAGGAVPNPVLAQSATGEPVSGRAFTPDLSEAELPVSARKGNLVIAPIPFSNPTLETGLMGGVAYFHPQTEAQASAQPASVTGVGVLYSENDSYGYGIGHSAYWKEDRWRFNGALAYMDLILPLLGQDDTGKSVNVDWLLDGTLASAELSRRVGRNWYAGISLRQVDLDQTFSLDFGSAEFELADSFTTAAIGLSVIFDTRDMPTNAYEGRYFKLTSKYTRPSIGGELSYDAYSLAFRSYHALAEDLVLAWNVEGCSRSDGLPLWDACRIGLRGLASTDYLGRSSLVGEAEIRWHFSQRWGAVAFAGAGTIDNSLSEVRDKDSVGSYGVGLRLMIQQEKRINMRLDYGRSRDGDAIHFFVGEAF